MNGGNSTQTRLFHLNAVQIANALGLVLLTLSATAVNANTNQNSGNIWKSEKDGVTVYSDQHSPNSQPVSLNSSTHYTPPPAKQNPSSALTTTQTKPQQNTNETPQWQIQLLSPHNEQAIRANNGAITFHFTLAPLNTTTLLLDKHTHIQWVLDNQSPQVIQSADIKKQQDTQHFTLQNLDRGEHSIHLQVIDKSGKIIAKTPVTVFYVLRYHINAPN